MLPKCIYAPSIPILFLLAGPIPAPCAAADDASTPSSDLLLDTAKAFNTRARWDDAERLLLQALAMAAKDPKREIRLKIELGKVLTTRATYTDLPLDDAAKRLEEAVQTARAQKDPELLGDALYALATCRYANQFRGVPNYGPTRQALQEALAIREKAQDQGRLAETFFYLGLVHEHMDEGPQAKARYERALDLAVKAGDKLTMASLYRHLADFQRADRGPAGVLDYHQKCLALNEEVGFSIGVIFSSVAVAETLMEMKKSDQAQGHYERAKVVAKACRIHRGAAQAHMGLAGIKFAAGNTDQAREEVREALVEAAQCKDRGLVDTLIPDSTRIFALHDPASAPSIDLLLDTAKAFNTRARWGDAERLLLQALAMAAKDPKREIRLKIELGKVLTTRATYTDLPLESASKSLEEAVQAARAQKDPELLGDALYALATCRYANQFRGVPDYGPTRLALQEALAIREKAQDQGRLAETHFYLGLVHERLDEGPQAKARYERALDLAARAGDKLATSYAYRHLAGFQRPEKGIQGELDYHQRSLKLREELGFSIGIVFGSVAVAEAFLEMKQPSQAQPHFERALSVAKECRIHRGAAYARAGLAAVHHAAGHMERAREEIREALSEAAYSQDQDVIGAVMQRAASLR